MIEKQYIAIDLKSFYASVECVERGLDPLTANLVVADPSRTEKTICLAVSPPLKSFGIPGRARLFEVIEQVKRINLIRKEKAGGELVGASRDAEELKKDPKLALDYYIAPPQMGKYIKISSKIYEIYLKYVSEEDIHVYSIDEVFIDVTEYLSAYRMTARELAKTIVLDVFRETGITATAGIGTNLYLCKVAMDINAKHAEPDETGARIAELNERSYREKLWSHRPLTDFWRVGRGYAHKLESHGLYTMGDIARCSLTNEDLIYEMFGVNAELLIDHAWGWEPCTMREIKLYVPESSSVSSGQVLHAPYDFGKAEIVVREMAESLVMDLVRKELVTDRIGLAVGYDKTNLSDAAVREKYSGQTAIDFYGREVPRHAHGLRNLKKKTSSAREIVSAAVELYREITDRNLLIRRITITADRVERAEIYHETPRTVQLNLFSDVREEEEERIREEEESRRQKAVLEIQNRYGKNAVLKGTDIREGATMIERNNQIGGHKA